MLRLLLIPRRLATYFRALSRGNHLRHFPRSPHQGTFEFAQGWRACFNGRTSRDCPFNDLLRTARWQDGHDAARRARLRAATGGRAAANAEWS